MLVVRSASTDEKPGRALLREVARDVMGDAEATVLMRCPECGADDHGAPSIAHSPWRISLARADDLVVVAASDDGAVGIDVEPVAVGDDRVQAIGHLTGVWSVEHWTRAEAVLKADGRGLLVDPGAVHVDGDDAWVDGEPTRYRLAAHAIDPAYVVTTAVASPPPLVTRPRA